MVWRRISNSFAVKCLCSERVGSLSSIDERFGQHQAARSQFEGHAHIALVLRREGSLLVTDRLLFQVLIFVAQAASANALQFLEKVMPGLFGIGLQAAQLGGRNDLTNLRTLLGLGGGRRCGRRCRRGRWTHRLRVALCAALVVPLPRFGPLGPGRGETGVAVSSGGTVVAQASALKGWGAGRSTWVCGDERLGRGGGDGGATSGLGGAGAAATVFGLPPTTQPVSESTNTAATNTSTCFMFCATIQSAIGKRIKKDVPFPGSLVKSIVPSCNCTIRNVIANPMPDPSCLVVKYRRKILSRSSSGIPRPESVIRMPAVSSVANDSKRSSPPSGMACMAFTTTLRTACFIRSRSTRTSTPSACLSI